MLWILGQVDVPAEAQHSGSEVSEPLGGREAGRAYAPHTPDLVDLGKGVSTR